MRRSLILILVISSFGCSEFKTKKDLNYVLDKFKQNSNSIEHLEYKMHRIDTFPPDGEVWNNKGIAYVERDVNDSLFGLSFFAKSFNIEKQYVYKNSIGYEFNLKTKQLKNEENAIGFLGKPGGQMVSTNIFTLDSVYSNLTLDEKKDVYVLNYEFENDSIHNIEQKVKIIYLRKKDYFPVKIVERQLILDHKASTEYNFTSIKINLKGHKKIGEIIQEMVNESTQIKTNKYESVVGKVFDNISLPELSSDNLKKIDFEKPTLIDFWETWCGPCIESFPNIENLHNKYSESVQILGIVSDDRKNARKLIENNGYSFPNLYGNKNILEQYKINSYPRYLLINNEGKILKEYFGFSIDIEKDIKDIIDDQKKN